MIDDASTQCFKFSASETETKAWWTGDKVKTDFENVPDHLWATCKNMGVGLYEDVLDSSRACAETKRTAVYSWRGRFDPVLLKNLLNI